jgi:hypothetical protein
LDDLGIARPESAALDDRNVRIALRHSAATTTRPAAGTSSAPTAGSAAGTADAATAGSRSGAARLRLRQREIRGYEAEQRSGRQCC